MGVHGRMLDPIEVEVLENFMGDPTCLYIPLNVMWKPTFETLDMDKGVHLARIEKFHVKPFSVEAFNLQHYGQYTRRE
jgi:hypothetical protein